MCGRFNSNSFIGCAVLVLLLSACSHTPMRKEISQDQRLFNKGYAIDEEVESIPNYHISAWNFLDSKGLILSGGPSQKYLVTFKNPCRDLQWANSIATTSTISRLTRFDTVIPLGSGGIPARCLIEKIYALQTVEEELND